MPKGKPKKRNENLRNKLLMSKTEFTELSDDDSTNDSASVCSFMSGSIGYEDGVKFRSEDSSHLMMDDDDDGDLQELFTFESKLDQAIEGMFEKSVQTRVQNIEAVSSALRKKYVPEPVSTRRMTIVDLIERSLKKGRGNEQAAAAQLAVLLVIQLGSSEETDEICQTLVPLLMTIVGDKSMTHVVRAKCCFASSVLLFVGNYEGVDDVMETLRQTFKNGTNVSCSADEVALYTAAISAWCLLLTVTSTTDSFLMYMKKVIGLLDSNSVEIRMAVGEVIAVAMELDSVDEWEPDDNVLSKLKELATDSHKYRAKKDRTKQRSAFRDIVKYIEDRECPTIKVRFGRECLELDSWCVKKQYDAFAQALGSGMNLHLLENDLLRDVFQLGDKILVAQSSHELKKKNKLQRNMVNAAAFKARSISRAKHRDKKNIQACVRIE